MSNNSVLLPNGEQFLIHMDYSKAETEAVLALIITSVISLVAVIALLVLVTISAIRTWNSKEEGLFIRSHVAGYFVSLLITDLLQAVGSIMNAKWMQRSGVDYGDFCVAQGVIKQAADVGTATWVLVIAIHTFNVLFLRLRLQRYMMIVALIGAWSFVFAIILAGPGSLDTATRGPFFGISGYWCWISNGYPAQRITLDYMLLFISAFSSFILYSLVFLRLRGNIRIAGKRVIFKFVSKNEAWRLHYRDPADASVMTVARQMLLYPIAYTIIILPIAAVRFAEWTGHTVPFAVVIFSDTVYLLSGLVNALLFLFTRRILPPGTMLPSFRWLRPPSNMTLESGKSLANSPPSTVQQIQEHSKHEKRYENGIENIYVEGDRVASPEPIIPSDIESSPIPSSFSDSSLEVIEEEDISEAESSRHSEESTHNVPRSREEAAASWVSIPTPIIDVDIGYDPPIQRGVERYWERGSVIGPGPSIYSIRSSPSDVLSHHRNLSPNSFTNQSIRPLVSSNRNLAASPALSDSSRGGGGRNISTIHSDMSGIPEHVFDPRAPPGMF